MSNPVYPSGPVAAGGVVAALSGWTVAGWLLLGTSVLIAVGMTVMRLRRRRA
jgi:hypothetical protein